MDGEPRMVCPFMYLLIQQRWRPVYLRKAACSNLWMTQEVSIPQSHGGAGELSPDRTVILLAEDDPIVRNLIQLMLTRQGYVVLTANDGQEALELCDKFKDAIHLLLTDVRMPRMDGWTLAQHVRDRRSDTKIVVISGETATTILEKNSADAFLRKPFVPPTLLKCIQRVLASSFHGACDEISKGVESGL